MKYPLLLLLISLFMITSLSAKGELEEDLQRAIDLVGVSASVYKEKRDCISCHHQSLPVMALAHARAAGYTVSNDTISEQNLYVQDYFQSRLKRMKEGNGVIGGAYTAGYVLLQMSDAKINKDETIEALTAYLLKTQKPDGSWRIRTHRPPLEDSDFTATALAIRGLLQYENQPETIQDAVEWLQTSQPKSTEDRVFQVLGLHWAEEETATFAEELAAQQRADGGWAQLPELESDAYATGQALYALLKTGYWKSDTSQQRAAGQWLHKNQKRDGSWHVKSRSRPIQKYFESGFPHGKDQFISISATCWAIMALLN